MQSPIPWMGGKRRLAKHLLPLFPEHSTYVEPFCGGASLFFMRSEPAKVEVLNDMDSELVCFYRVIKNHWTEFLRQFEYALCSRQLFEWANMTHPETLTDIQRAARFYYLQKMTFGAKSTGRTFGTAPSTPPKLNLARLENVVEDVWNRLSRVYIEHLDWAKVIEKYDRPYTFFFMDPPYHETAGYAAGKGFGLEDYEKIADMMDSMQGHAMLTINDHPEIREVFKQFNCVQLDINYTNGKQNKPAKELVFTNYEFTT